MDRALSKLAKRSETLCTLSVVVPVHNEELSIAVFMNRMEPIMIDLGVSYEIVFIDDGSRDGTFSEICRFEKLGFPISILKLSRNFGKEAAVTAGLDFARGEAILVMDVDLQDPPELIPEFVRLWRQGYDVVYGARRSRHGDGVLKRLTAASFYLAFNAFSDLNIPQDAGDYRLMDRRVVEALKRLPERERFMKGLFAWVGFRQIGVPFDRPPRAEGKTSWNYWRLFRFAVNGITSFSSIPLTIWTAVGFFIAAFAGVWAIWLLLRTLMFGIDLPGYASTLLVILFLGGIQLLGLGIMGQYISQLYREVKRRPIYIIDEERHTSQSERDVSGTS